MTFEHKGGQRKSKTQLNCDPIMSVLTSRGKNAMEEEFLEYKLGPCIQLKLKVGSHVALL